MLSAILRVGTYVACEDTQINGGGVRFKVGLMIITLIYLFFHRNNIVRRTTGYLKYSQVKYLFDRCGGFKDHSPTVHTNGTDTMHTFV